MDEKKTQVDRRLCKHGEFNCLICLGEFILGEERVTKVAISNEIVVSDDPVYDYKKISCPQTLEEKRLDACKPCQHHRGVKDNFVLCVFRSRVGELSPTP